jgi:hypothetical protein
VWLRAALIIGSGSASFEMLRYLTERLPVMVTPRWARTRIQPIAIRDVPYHLVAAADLPAEVSPGSDIGGPDVLIIQPAQRGLTPPPRTLARRSDSDATSTPTRSRRHLRQHPAADDLQAPAHSSTSPRTPNHQQATPPPANSCWNEPIWGGETTGLGVSEE